MCLGIPLVLNFGVLYKLLVVVKKVKSLEWELMSKWGQYHSRNRQGTEPRQGQVQGADGAHLARAAPPLQQACWPEAWRPGSLSVLLGSGGLDTAQGGELTSTGGPMARDSELGSGRS